MGTALDERKNYQSTYRYSGDFLEGVSSLNFPDWTTETRLLEDAMAVRSMADEMSLVLKPLRNYGGKGIVRIKQGIVEDGTLTFTLDQHLQRQDLEWPVLGMKYLEKCWFR